MADFGIFIGFGRPVRGREREAATLYDETVEYYSRLEKEGQIESFESVFLEPHGGDLDGFFLVRGDQNSLAGVRASDEFALLTMRAGLLTENLGVVGAALSERIAIQRPLYEQQLEQLT